MSHRNKWSITKEFLEQEYLNKKRSLLILSKELEIPYETLFWYKKKFGIPTISANYWGKERRNSPLTEFKKGLSPWNKGTKGLMNVWNKGKKYSEDHKIKITIATKQAMSRPEVKEKVKKTQFPKGIIPWNKNRTNVYSKETVDKIRKARLSQILPKKNTNAEKALFQILTELKLVFEKQVPIKNICQADAFIKPNIVLFADGDYWHCNPRFYKNPISLAQNKNIERDRKQNMSYPETISLREVISFHVIKPLLSFSEQMLVLVSPARRSVNFGEAVFRYTNAQILLWLRMPIDVDHRLQTTSQLSHYSVGASPDRVSV